ncbi:MAG: heme-binding domain-containing protein [Opitutae bacterium]|nr:heme-binding domain-containing protein [Opitutae bacterium]
MIKKILLGLLGLVVLAQFIRPARNESAGTGPNDITVKHPVPATVAGLLQRACYDCHSNHSHYPWYAEVQPVGWWLAWHVNDGKRHLNFSEFAAYTPKRAKTKAGEIGDEVEQQKMPLRSYTWLHPEARLTPAEIKLITDWAEGLEAKITVP